MGMERVDERVARGPMSEVLGVPVEQNDDGSGPAMFDFRFRRRYGRLAAAEMTTLTDEHSLSANDPYNESLALLMRGQCSHSGFAYVPAPCSRNTIPLPGV